MADYADLNGNRIISASVAIPYYGTWVADVVLADTAPLTPNVTLSIGNVTLIGYVKRMANFAGSRSARIVGGFGGWGTQIEAKAYQSPVQLTRSLIMTDAAIEVGEALLSISDEFVGQNFVREAAPAERLLRQLCGPLWYMNAIGQTVIGGARTSTLIRSDYEVISWSGAKGHFSIATEDMASWMPGNQFISSTVTTVQTLSMVRYEATNDGILRVEALVT